MDKPSQQYAFSTAAPIAICGVPFDNVTAAETIGLIKQMVQSRRPHYLATANVDFLVQAMHDVELRRILFDAHLVLCDGTPLVWASRLLGNPLAERVAGSDLIPLVLKVAAEEGFRPFFLGATPDAIESAVANVRQRYPGIQIAGHYSPPFNKLLEMDHDEIRNRIRAAQPDMLFVGFGCPKQEKWINMHYRSLGVPVSIGVGATIDFLAEKMARAPRWMQQSGTEWIFRLCQEPRRLFGRYARDLYFFSGGIGSQAWNLRARKKERRQQPRSKVEQNAEYMLLAMPPRLDFEAVHHDRDLFESAATRQHACIVDLRNVEFIDSTGIGMLIRLQKKARLLGQAVVLLAPSSNLERSLRLMRLETFFDIAPDLPAAVQKLREGKAGTQIVLKQESEATLPVLAWRGELTAANAESLWAATLEHLSARSLLQGPVIIDLSELSFIDSTGLSMMIRTKKQAARQGTEVRFKGATDAVMNVVRISRLEDFLFRE